ncbi:type II toxin-antitoxin system VapC family toxin [Microvirga alba]|uniref:Type II toxin-antitoxin system VapC family toxin n=1 Tax=Microvirga alba TaxID=2791025 RepID=A0A931BQI6_9HYPH|nr:type II toxin-antitoxin system VapC family toxin [Microvirga alba]MBF9235621.1 type II toxin-antitoxin system VapC family toxin [Microvirga alba]
MFLDASAVLGILLQEEDREELLERIEAATTPLTTSPVAVMESVANLASKGSIPVEKANEIVAEFMKTLNVRNVPITPEIGARAIRIFAKYGKGQNHPARLNMGDCFAAAVAKNYGIPLLYKGNDFIHTDLR